MGRIRTGGVFLRAEFRASGPVSAGLYHATGDAVVIMTRICRIRRSRSRAVENGAKAFRWFTPCGLSATTRCLSNFCMGFYRILSKAVPSMFQRTRGFCLLDRRVVEVMNALPERNRYLRGLRAWSGFRQTGLEFERTRAPPVAAIHLQKIVPAGDGRYVFVFQRAATAATYLGLAVSLGHF